jgi:hypothetical protein
MAAHQLVRKQIIEAKNTGKSLPTQAKKARTSDATVLEEPGLHCVQIGDIVHFSIFLHLQMALQVIAF